MADEKKKRVGTDRGRYRTKRFEITLFDEEAAILKRKAEEYGASKTEYLRDMILFGFVRKSKRDLLSDEKFNKLLYELNKIGNNINQIAYNSNLKKATGKEEIAGLTEQYDSLLSLYEDTFLYPEENPEHGDYEES